CLLIVDDVIDRCLETELGVVAIQAGVIGKLLAVAAKADLIVGCVKAAIVQKQLAAVVALKSGARNYVKDTIGTITEFSRVTAATDLEIINIFRVKLWAHVAGDIGVGYGHAVNHPADLVSTANVEQVVHQV